MPLITVIVPVYKVEQYLPACVDSILAQTFKDFELILVDDGSPDNCGAICDSYTKNDQRVKVIHQGNQGLSGARNSAMDIAAGEYIAFIDSDDMVSFNYLEILYSEIIKNNADVSCCKLQEFEKLDFMSNNSDNISDVCTTLMSGRDAALSIYNGTGEVGIYACGKLYRSSLFEKKRFPVSKIHEDQAIIPIVLYEADCVVAIDIRNYYYRIRSNSITRTNFKVNRFDNIEAIDSCINYFLARKDDEIVFAAKKARKRVNALLVILAESSGMRDEIPKKYYMTRMQAIYYCYKYTSNSTYSWYLSQLYPSGWVVHEYFMKVKSMLQRLLNVKKRRM